MSLRHLFDLEPHGPDTFVGIGPRYPWGGLYGGQIVAQALRAAAATVDEELLPHSLRAYFIRRGDHAEPIRFEVDRIRNGRSFATRRVVARQATGAILNLEASFHRDEDDARHGDRADGRRHPGAGHAGEDVVDAVVRPSLGADGARSVPHRVAPPPVGSRAWLKVDEPLGDDELLQRCWLAYLSDDLPTDSVGHAVLGWDDSDHEQPADPEERNDRWADVMSASLDHTIWFHRPVRADEWHLHDFTCHGYVGARGLSIGHIFSVGGQHVATVAQEVVLRPAPTPRTRRDRAPATVPRMDLPPLDPPAHGCASTCCGTA